MTQITKCINAISHSKRKILAGVWGPVHTRSFYSLSTGIKQKPIGQRQCLFGMTIQAALIGLSSKKPFDFGVVTSVLHVTKKPCCLVLRDERKFSHR